MSFALAGCGTGTKLGGADVAKKVLPPGESLPAELRTVADKPSSRPLAAKKCSYFSDTPGGWCKDAVAAGDAGYRSSDKSRTARFHVVVYRSDTAARKAFRLWGPYVRNSSTKYQVLNAETLGSESVAFAGNKDWTRDDQKLVIHQGQFIGTVEYRGSTAQGTADPTLIKLAKMFTERMRQGD
ncbi:hypothetical protein ADL22_21720 [Streptomyces sp. NRRL F-4489]|nr:hypothetical protein ADL22_21720 [Streptomyces sp. NRRL F-4489]